MEKLRKSSSLKIISYILIPFLVLAIMAGIIYIDYNSYNKEDIAKKDYYKTDSFVYHQYYPYLENVLNICEYIEKNYIKNADNYILVKETPNKIYYSQTYRNYYEGFNYIIIDEQGTIYTNIQTENYNVEKEKIITSNYYWYKENESINSTLEQINETGLIYNYGIEELKEIKDNKFDIYISFDEEQVASLEDNLDKIVYNILINMGNIPIYIMAFSIILLLIIGIYLIWSIGHSKNYEDIHLNKFDKFPYEIIAICALIVIAIFVSIATEATYYSNILTCIIIFVSYLICYIACAILGITTIKRIKAHHFIKTTLIYKVCKWIYKKTREIGNLILWNKATSTKLIVYYIAFLVISLILMLTARTGISVIILLVFWVWALYKILSYAKQIHYIKQSLEKVYEGEENIKIDTANLERNLKQMAEYINSLSTGLTKAVEESLKSERMKTELITNVSHDIKTPLTSIINYVDLLKKEEMPNEKAKEYLDILDKKSQRLKRLTEDLVEASKASSGNIKLNIESINVKELINQVSGEFEDKLKENNLELILDMPKGDVTINADSRYLYRVIENMYSNIAKYALKNSRVYVDVTKQDNKVRIELKNISKEKLNITADELMQRFVRGEASRNTEGSGLGLSIAESLTKLQGGTFQIYLDGDLFKVIIEFEK